MASLIRRNGAYYVSWREGGKQRRKSLKTTKLGEARKRLDFWNKKQAERD